MINKQITPDKKRKQRIKIAFLRVTLMAMLLILSTYAWFTSQKDITISNIRGTVEVVENMEISLDAKTWYQKIDLSEATNVFVLAQSSRDEALGETGNPNKTTDVAVLPELLFPVSGVGKTGATLLPLYSGEATSTSLSSIEQCAEVSNDGYIAFDIYIKNTSRDNEADVLQLNINSSAQVLTETISKQITDVTGNRVNRTYNGNDASGLQNTVRVALAKYDGEISSTATQKEILESTKQKNILDVAIWEPNAYDHVESIVSNNNKLINGSNTSTISFTEYHPMQDLETYALNENAVGETIENVYNIASTGLGAQSTFKTDNIKNGANEIESYRIKTENEKPLDIKNVLGNNFEISPNKVTRYRVYVWLEGQDVDCINVASLGGGIELDLGLTKDDETGEVLVNADNRVSYSTLAQTVNPVTATITMEEEITPLPEGWEYVDATTKVAIQKEYENNKIEQVKVASAAGSISTIEVAVLNIDSEPSTFTQTVSASPQENYGLYIDYPVDLDGDTTNNDWKIFYADGEHVFLIADDFIPSNLTKSGIVSKSILADPIFDGDSTLYYGTKYNVYWDTNTNLPTSNYISQSVMKKYLFTKAIPTVYKNYLAVTSLLNTSNWNNFVNSTYAEDAIGGPTLEMWISSWNQKYEGDSYYPQFTCEWDTTNNLGYLLGTDTLNDNYTFDTSFASEDLYYTHTSYEECVDIDNNGTNQVCLGYYLATPSAGLVYDLGDEGEHPKGVYCVGWEDECFVGSISYDMPYGIGLRPLVCLKTYTEATKVDDVWMLEE